MQIIIDIDDNLYTRLFDNGVDNYDDELAKAIRKGTPLPKGVWVDGGYKNEEDWISETKTYRCSRCGNARCIRTDFCPNCGADMKETVQEEKSDNPMQSFLGYMKNLYIQNKDEVDKIAKEMKLDKEVANNG